MSNPQYDKMVDIAMFMLKNDRRNLFYEWSVNDIIAELVRSLKAKELAIVSDGEELKAVFIFNLDKENKRLWVKHMFTEGKGMMKEGLKYAKRCLGVDSDWTVEGNRKYRNRVACYNVDRIFNKL